MKDLGTIDLGRLSLGSLDLGVIPLGGRGGSAPVDDHDYLVWMDSTGRAWMDGSYTTTVTSTI